VLLAQDSAGSRRSPPARETMRIADLEIRRQELQVIVAGRRAGLTARGFQVLPCELLCRRERLAEQLAESSGTSAA
jgi:DNA-binding response OmpR family regulator